MDFDLRPLKSDAAMIVPDLLEAFDPGAPREELVRIGADLVLQFHILAAGTLLVDGNVEKFFLHLSRCAENGLRLLELLRKRGLAPVPASHDVPLRAALAAGDWDRGAAIVEHSAQERDHAASEYEDEYLWARALQLLAVGGGGAELGGVLDRLEAVAGDTHGARVAAARALGEREPEAFKAAMVEAAQAYAEVTEKRAATFGTPVRKFAPHRHLWLEGLALLRLGERAGLRVGRQLRYCPRLARSAMPAP